MTDPSDFPTELAVEGDSGGGAMRWIVGVVALTSLALTLANADSIADWAEDLAPSPAAVRVVALSEGWRGVAERLRLSAPHASLHHLWQRAERARWPAEATPPSS
jgi:hypothetical protein